MSVFDSIFAAKYLLYSISIDSVIDLALFLNSIYPIFYDSYDSVAQHHFIMIVIDFYQFHIYMMLLAGNGHDSVIAGQHEWTVSSHRDNIAPWMLDLDTVCLSHDP
jgi:hypothetical protein